MLKRTMAILLAAMLVLGSLGTVVFAAEAPVITDAYIAGFPVPGKYLHVIADGTYDGQSLSKTTAVTATYSWEYGFGDSWTAVNAQAMNRFVLVTSDMIGQTVRCTVTPTDGTNSGTPVVVTFPTPVVADASAPWKTVTTSYSFDQEADVQASGIVARNNNTMQWDEATRSVKFTGWSTMTDSDTDTVYMSSGSAGFNVNDIAIAPDRIVSLSYKANTDQGTIESAQTAFEIQNAGITEKAYISNIQQAIRWGYYTNPSYTSTTSNVSTTVESYELASRTHQARMQVAGAIMTPDLMMDSGAIQYWMHPHISNGKSTTTLIDNPTAYYIDDLTITQKGLVYDVAASVNGKTGVTREVMSGSGLCYSFAPEIGALETVKSVTATNGAKAEYKDGLVYVSRVYADTQVNIVTSTFTPSSISLGANTVNFVGTACTEQPLTVTLFDAEGNSKDADASGLSGVTFTSSDPSVFTVNGGTVSSTGTAGKSTITATYNGMTASVMMVYSPSQIDGTGDFADQKWNVKTENNMTLSVAKDTTVPGHNDSVSWSFGTNPALSTYNNNYYALRLYEGRNNWWDKGVRSLSGWFYDDLTSPISMYLEMGLSKNYEKRTINDHLAQSFGYGEFTAKWQSVEKIWQSTRLKAALNGTQYRLDNETSGTVLGTRTKGWHQVLYSIGKDPSAELGWSVFIYLDGQQVAKKAIGSGGSEDPHIELRVEPTKNGAATDTNQPLYPHRADDLMMGGSLEKDVFGVHFNVGEHGKVKVGTEEKADGAWDYVTEGGSMTLTIEPDSTYSVDTVKLGETPLTVSAGNQVTLTGITADSELNVTFKREGTELPEFVSRAAWFRNVDGTPTLYAYAKVNNYWGQLDNFTYGMNLRTEGMDETDALELLVRDSDGTPMILAPGAAFAIKAYGSAITADQTYYMRATLGGSILDTETKLTFDDEEKSNQPVSKSNMEMEEVRN